MRGELQETAVEHPPNGSEAFAVYVYAVARRLDVEPMLAGEGVPASIEPPAPLGMVAAGLLAAIVSAVPLPEYGEQALEARLQELEWTGVRALRHEQVVRHFAARVTTVPLRFGTIYLHREGVERMLRERREELEALITRLHGREEWSVHLYRDGAQLAAYVDSHSSRLREFNQAAGQASPGRAYLLGKKRAALRAEEARAATMSVVEALERGLTGVTEAGARLRRSEGEEADRGAPVAAWAFLVERARFPEFHAVSEELAAEHAASGFRLELRGPWPAYHFTGSGQGSVAPAALVNG